MRLVQVAPVLEAGCRWLQVQLRRQMPLAVLCRWRLALVVELAVLCLYLLAQVRPVWAVRCRYTAAQVRQAQVALCNSHRQMVVRLVTCH